MAVCWVRVERSDGAGHGQGIYVNGNYVDEAGTVGTPFVVETGDNLFETFNDEGEIDWRVERVIGLPPPGDRPDNPVSVTLNPVP